MRDTHPRVQVVWQAVASEVRPHVQVLRSFDLLAPPASNLAAEDVHGNKELQMYCGPNVVTHCRRIPAQACGLRR